MPRYRLGLQALRPSKGPRRPPPKQSLSWPLAIDQQGAHVRGPVRKPTRLWNGHRPVQRGQLKGPVSVRALIKANKSDEWKNAVAPDVVEFVEKAKINAEERLRVLLDPPKYFSYPENVPTELRKQISFPNFTVTLLRTTHLPPKYASFIVPLWFNKLDMKSYLSSLYDVDVLHVRSTVLPAKVARRKPVNPRGRGQLYRPQAQKKMTVELVEPFVWPEPEEDLTPWETKTYYEGMKWSIKENRKQEPDVVNSEPNLEHRKKIAEHAREYLLGKTPWKPTWQSIAADVRVMKGLDQPPPSASQSTPSLPSPLP